MNTLNIHIHCYDDFEILKGAIATIPDWCNIYVLDGRYVSFEGEINLTPGLEEWCEDKERIKYCKPDKDMLPFGINSDLDQELRPDVTLKGEWAVYDVLPQDEWTMKMDTDERIVKFEIPDDLDKTKRYVPNMRFIGDDHANLIRGRLYVPKYWSIWINDCLIPRDLCPRNASITERKKIAQNNVRVDKLGIESIVIDNFGPERDDDYLKRRQNQLKDMGNNQRADIFNNFIDDT